MHVISDENGRLIRRVAVRIQCTDPSISIYRASVAHTDESWAIDATRPIDISIVSRSNPARRDPQCFFAQPLKDLLHYAHYLKYSFLHGRRIRNRQTKESSVVLRPKIPISRFRSKSVLPRKSCMECRNPASKSRRCDAKQIPGGMATRIATDANIHL